MIFTLPQKTGINDVAYAKDANGNVTGLVASDGGVIALGGGGSKEVNYLKPATIGFAGDSIAVMYASANGNSPMSFIKYDLYPCDIQTIFTSAVGGTSSSHLISTQIAQLEALTVKPTIMVVQSLQNDFMATEANANTFLAYITEYATRALASGVQLVCLCSRPPKSESTTGVPQAITYINRKLDEFCRETEGCYYVNVFDAWRNTNLAEATTRINYNGTPSTATALSDDGTHPLPRAIQKIAPLLEPVIRKYARPIYPVSSALISYNNSTALWANIAGANGLFVGTSGQLNGVNNTNVAGTGTTDATRWKITANNGIIVTPSIVVGTDGYNYQQLVFSGTATADSTVEVVITPATNIILGNFFIEGIVQTISLIGVKSIELRGLDASVSLSGQVSTFSEVDVENKRLHFRSSPFSKEVTNYAGFPMGVSISIEKGRSPTGTVLVGRVGGYRVSIG